MKHKIVLIVLMFFILAFHVQDKTLLPDGFVHVKTLMPDLDVELRYYSTNNFVGDTITGYKANTLILTQKAAKALQQVQDELYQYNLCLKVYDGYRPQRAVNHFMRWARAINDTLNKQTFYPNVAKSELFKEEYIATRSGHSRGSTLDLTLTNGDTGVPLDMGSPYDFFGEESWINYEHITEAQKSNRQLLQTVMLRHNFRNYPKEWWHFTLRWEPFTDTFFDFEVE
jgi:D-alanyl-D-alanine dipeptidase